MAARGSINPVRSSLPYQTIMYCNSYYFALFWVAEIFIFIFKGEILPYPTGILAAEVVLLFIMAALEFIRMFMGMKGNLTERVVSVVVSLLLTLPSIFGCLYLIIWQTYVLRLEVIINSVQLAFIALEVLFGIISFITFARAAAP